MPSPARDKTREVHCSHTGALNGMSALLAEDPAAGAPPRPWVWVTPGRPWPARPFWPRLACARPFWPRLFWPRSAGWVLPRLGIVLASGTLGAILDATVGAVIVLVILSLIRRA